MEPFKQVTWKLLQKWINKEGKQVIKNSIYNKLFSKKQTSDPYLVGANIFFAIKNQYSNNPSNLNNMHKTDNTVLNNMHKTDNTAFQDMLSNTRYMDNDETYIFQTF